MGREEDIAAIATAIGKLGETPLGLEPGRENATSGRYPSAPPRYADAMPAAPLASKPFKFNTELNITMVLSVISSIFVAVWWLSTSISHYQEAQTVIMREIATMRRDIDAANTAAINRTERYAPRISELENQNKIQDDRMKNFADGLIDLRRALAEMGINLSQLREDMATVRATMQLDNGRRRRVENTQPSTER